ncbi:hypothetical protein WKW50_25075 [Ochrobactrum sp. GPK 3]
MEQLLKTLNAREATVDAKTGRIALALDFFFLDTGRNVSVECRDRHTHSFRNRLERIIPLLKQSFGLNYSRPIHGFRSPASPCFFSSIIRTRKSTLADQIALKFGDGGKDMKRKPPTR